MFQGGKRLWFSLSMILCKLLAFVKFTFANALPFNFIERYVKIMVYMYQLEANV